MTRMVALWIGAALAVWALLALGDPAPREPTVRAAARPPAPVNEPPAPEQPALAEPAAGPEEAPRSPEPEPEPAPEPQQPVAEAAPAEPFDGVVPPKSPLRKRFDGEAVDSLWAGRTERELRRFVEELDLGPDSLLGMECRETLCRMRFAASESDDYLLFQENALEDLPYEMEFSAEPAAEFEHLTFREQGRIFRERGGEPNMIEAIVYVGREGYPLKQAP